MSFSQLVRYPVTENTTIVVRHAKERDMDDMTMMPDFFAPDFSLEVATGFVRVWDGTYALLRYLQSPEGEERFGLGLNGSLRRDSRPNCIELGSGSGLFGLCVAAKGANVLLTDVKSSVDCITSHNVALNGQSQGSTETVCADSFFVEGATAYNVGLGSAAALPLDWSLPVSENIVKSVREGKCDLILACDCIWLPSLATMCSNIIATLLCESRKNNGSTKALLSYPRLGGDGRCSTVKDIEAIFAASGLIVKWIDCNVADSSEEGISVFKTNAKPDDPSPKQFDVSLLEVVLTNDAS